MKIGIITLVYNDFDYNEFHKNFEKYFLPSHTKIFYLFTNKSEYIYPKNVHVYYSNKNIGMFTNISDILNDIHKDKVNLLFYSGLNVRFNIDTGSQMIPNDDSLFSSINENNEPMFYNLTALLDHIQDNENKKIYGSYIDNFTDIINFYKDMENEKLKNKNNNNIDKDKDKDNENST